MGIEACLVAVAVGARIIEKHFTLDHETSDFRDHRHSADPEEMRRLVGEIPKIQTLLGRPEKRVQPCEEECLRLARRSIVAAADLSLGHSLGWGDLAWIRPAEGLPPGEEERLLGRRLRRAKSYGEPILLSDVE
jgi:sialic acid synthase SpsE